MGGNDVEHCSLLTIARFLPPTASPSKAGARLHPLLQLTCPGRTLHFSPFLILPSCASPSRCQGSTFTLLGHSSQATANSQDTLGDANFVIPWQPGNPAPGFPPKPEEKSLLAVVCAACTGPRVRCQASTISTHLPLINCMLSTILNMNETVNARKVAKHARSPLSESWSFLLVSAGFLGVWASRAGQAPVSAFLVVWVSSVANVLYGKASYLMRDTERYQALCARLFRWRRPRATRMRRILRPVVRRASNLASSDQCESRRI